jgi:hypothetical protein
MSAKSLSADHLAADSGYLLGLSGIEMKEGHESRSHSRLNVSDEIPKTACQWAPGGVLILVLPDGRLPVYYIIIVTRKELCLKASAYLTKFLPRSCSIHQSG